MSTRKGEVLGLPRQDLLLSKRIAGPKKKRGEMLIQ
jgi:hypothetical protein